MAARSLIEVHLGVQRLCHLGVASSPNFTNFKFDNFGQMMPRSCSANDWMELAIRFHCSRFRLSLKCLRADPPSNGLWGHLIGQQQGADADPVLSLVVIAASATHLATWL